MGIITTKTIRITSRGRYITKKGVALGPEKFFHKESLSYIKDLFDDYPAIKIEEKVPQNRAIVNLNVLNYDQDNFIAPITTEEGMTDEDEDNKEPEKPVTQQGAPAIPQQHNESKPVQNPTYTPVYVPVGTDANESVIEDNKEPEKPVTQQGAPAIPQQHNNNQKKKNKNHQKLNNTEVTPKEA